MLKSRRKLYPKILIVILILSIAYVVIAYSLPTIDPSPGKGIWDLDWFNASIGVNAPDYFRDGMNYSVWIESISGGGGVTDHGDLTGLEDDDHQLYFLQDGSEKLTGTLNASEGTITPWLELDGDNRTEWPTGGGETDHGSLTGLEDDDHPQYLLKELASSGLSDHGYSGTTITGVAGENLVLGNVVFLESTGKYWKADCNLTTKMYAVAIAVETINADATGTFLIEGYLRDDSWTAWTVGSETPLMVGWTEGTLTQTLPSSTGDQLQRVGYPIASKIIRFDPDSTVIELG